jgi:hypothetical protein
VAPSPTFSIAGNVGALYPGASAPLDLAITNPLKQALEVTSLSIGVKDDTGTPGCVGSRNYAVTPFAGSYPITVPAGATRRLSQLGYASSVWPRVRMLDLPVNQDACKGATVTLSYAGSATK